MSYRAGKSGLAAEAQQKIEGRYDPEEAAKCLTWVKIVSGEDIIPDSPNPASDASADRFYEVLHDGMVLCKLVDKLMPGKVNWKEKTFQVPKIQAMGIMRERERISKFTTLVQEYGVTDTYTFPTESLHEQGVLNLDQVCVCIKALGIQAQSKSVGPDGYWPKKVEKQTREWSEQQLRAGQNIIGLQAGSNKGASQAGMTMGKQRMVLD